MDSRAGLDVDLESHPLGWKISKTVSVGRIVAGRTVLALRVEAIGGRTRLLELVIGASERLVKGIIRAVRSRSGAGLIHLGKTAREHILGDRLQGRAG